MLALLEEDDGAAQEAAVDQGEGPLVEVRRRVDHDHVGVADGAVQVVAVPVQHADPAGGLDQGPEGAGEHVVTGDEDDPEGRAARLGDRRAGREGRARRGPVGPVGADREAGTRLGVPAIRLPPRPGWRGGRVGAAPGQAVGPAAGAHRLAPAPRPSATRVAETTRLSR
jgi:hypothetical protein